MSLTGHYSHHKNRYILSALFIFFGNTNKIALALNLGYLYKVLNDDIGKIGAFVDSLPDDLIREWEACFLAKGSSEK